MLDLITGFANQKGATPAQISLAWMLHKKDFIVPIFGARKPERIQENLNAADVELSDSEFNQIEAVPGVIKPLGAFAQKSRNYQKRLLLLLYNIRE